MSRRCLPHRIFLTASIACASLSVHAFLIPPEVTVVEYRNVAINHYFLTASTGEMAAIDAGAAGPGWIRTGFGFKAYWYDWCSVGCGWVDRFHGTPGVGPNSHFYTENPAESAGLRARPLGWDYEGQAFVVLLPVNGTCPGEFIPVYRLYNHRAIVNDTNHRYVTSAPERASMVAAGWIDEGIHFCSAGAVDVPLESHAVAIPDLGGNILPSAQCEDDAIRVGPCVAINNLPVPSARRMQSASDIYAFYDYTNVSSNDVFVPRAAATVAEILRDVFVHGGGYWFGVHVDTRNRGASMLSSINPLYQFRTHSVGGQADPRLFPWGAGRPLESQLSITHDLTLVRLAVRSKGSEAISHPTLEFIDQRSGLHLYFTVLTWGTQKLTNADYLARDGSTGKVIVGTGHRASIYGRSLGDPTFSRRQDVYGYVAGLPAGGSFEFRVDRSEFQRVIDAARTLEPALSTDPADYFVDNFHINNEVYGDAEVGLRVGNIALRLMRR